MESEEHKINELAALCGVVSEYWDIFGHRHEASIQGKMAIIKALGINIDKSQDIDSAISERRNREWKKIVPPVVVFKASQGPFIVRLHIPLQDGEEKGLTFIWTLENETSSQEERTFTYGQYIIEEERIIDGIRYLRIALSDIRRDRAIGYYNLSVQCFNISPIFKGEPTYSGKIKIIAVPDACYVPPELEKGKIWGINANLYSIKSLRNWGVGDLTDLETMLKWVLKLKGGFAGINPLHSIPNTKPFGISPYSPISRLYKNFIYIDIEKIPEAQGIVTELKSGLKEVRSSKLINYELIASLKKQALEEAFKVFYAKDYKKKTLRGLAFDEYLSTEGSALEAFSTYMALAETTAIGKSLKIKRAPVYNWQEWEEKYKEPGSDAVNSFKKRHKRTVLFYSYLQWLLNEQLDDVSEVARSQGMAVGIYHDLAIGSTGGGSDNWNYRELFAAGVDVGAPPDDFNPDGQNWGFPPLHPEKLSENGFEFFIKILRHNMKYFGALRIDHALGLFRLFWIPAGSHPSKGAYVENPSEDLLGIIALESIRNKTMIIAEDLGTIGDNVRDALLRYKMLSYRLFYFERNYPNLSFREPDAYPAMSLCSVTTHDLPTINGFWAGRDIALRKKLGLYVDDETWQRHLQERREDRRRIIEALGAAGIIREKEMNEAYAFMNAGKGRPEEEIIPPKLCGKVYEFLSKTPCKLLSVSLDDIIGTLDQQNMPGFTHEYPSWLQKTPIYLEKIINERPLSLRDRASA